MTKQKTHHHSDDSTTSRGTVKGHHERPGDDVTEGGPAAEPVKTHGEMKGAASSAQETGAEPGEDTSRATAGHAEKERAAQIAASKTQDGRGHRKHGE